MVSSKNNIVRSRIVKSSVMLIVFNSACSAGFFQELAGPDPSDPIPSLSPMPAYDCSSGTCRSVTHRSFYKPAGVRVFRSRVYQPVVSQSAVSQQVISQPVVQEQVIPQQVIPQQVKTQRQVKETVTIKEYIEEVPQIVEHSYSSNSGSFGSNGGSGFGYGSQPSYYIEESRSYTTSHNMAHSGHHMGGHSSMGHMAEGRHSGNMGPIQAFFEGIRNRSRARRSRRYARVQFAGGHM